MKRANINRALRSSITANILALIGVIVSAAVAVIVYRLEQAATEPAVVPIPRIWFIADPPVPNGGPSPRNSVNIFELRNEGGGAITLFPIDPTTQRSIEFRLLTTDGTILPAVGVELAPGQVRYVITHLTDQQDPPAVRVDNVVFRNADDSLRVGIGNEAPLAESEVPRWVLQSGLLCLQGLDRCPPSLADDAFDSASEYFYPYDGFSAGQLATP